MIKEAEITHYINLIKHIYNTSSGKQQPKRRYRSHKLNSVNFRSNNKIKTQPIQKADKQKNFLKVSACAQLVQSPNNSRQKQKKLDFKQSTFFRNSLRFKNFVSPVNLRNRSIQYAKRKKDEGQFLKSQRIQIQKSSDQLTAPRQSVKEHTEQHGDKRVSFLAKKKSKGSQIFHAKFSKLHLQTSCCFQTKNKNTVYTKYCQQKFEKKQHKLPSLNQLIKSIPPLLDIKDEEKSKKKGITVYNQSITERKKATLGSQEESMGCQIEAEQPLKRQSEPKYKKFSQAEFSMPKKLKQNPLKILKNSRNHYFAKIKYQINQEDKNELISGWEMLEEDTHFASVH